VAVRPRRAVDDAAPAGPLSAGTIKIRPIEGADRHPIHLRVDDDLRRSRLVVFFRILLVLPHLVWLLAWTVIALLTAIVGWIATLIRGRLPGPLHRFLSAYVRYAIHVQSFLYLAGNPFPGFTGAPGRYPIDVEIAAPERQGRWKVAFRLLLAVPALLVTGALSGGAAGSGSAAGAALTVAFLAWFAALIRGQMPRGFRDVVVYALQFGAQAHGYLFLLTDRYPDVDPKHVALPPLDVDRPVRVTDGGELERERLTVFFRLLLVLPHLVWLMIWGIGVGFMAFLTWIVVLFDRRPGKFFADFLGAYVRYATHVAAYLTLMARPFPGFRGREGTYPVDLHLDTEGLQNRWTVVFRLVLALPALIVSGALGNLLCVLAFLGWFVSLVRGRMPRSFVSAGMYAIRYHAQAYAYLFLLTGVYPHSSPTLE